ncbi:MAG: DUF397 domain-containing protein [Pseudonocardiaceae bacterium]
MSKYEIDLSRAVWRTASYTNGNAACVEAASLDGGFWGVRDTKDRAGPVLMVTHGQWTAFTAGVRLDEFG